MNAPMIWVVFPALVAVVALFLRKQRFLAAFGGGCTFLLAMLALIIPIDQAVQIGSFTFKINTMLQILGRRLVITASDAPLLVLFYGLVSMWLFGSLVTKIAERLVPLGLAITALTVASLAVEPFLYAAILIEIAILLAVPLLTVPVRPPGPGLMRFLIYQTLGMPFILFAGWLLAGVEASPADLALAIQSATILGLGFAFLMAVFPLYTWMPMLAEEAPPYILGFLFWILPTVTLIFGMGFLDRYAWIRNSNQLGPVLRTVGLLMVVTGGIWSAFQKHLGRMMAYSVIAETGISLLALSLPSPDAVQLFFLVLIPRSLGFLVWALSLESLSEQQGSLQFRSLIGIGRKYPAAALGLVLACFSIAGFPLLAGFPIRLALWNGLASQSLPDAFWFLVGTSGLLTGATRSLSVLVLTSEKFEWEINDGWGRIILIGIGVAGLFVLGFFPQLTQPLLQGLPAMFEHLGK
jgi:NADH-quinone oxidoreductase subunit N